MSYYIQRLRQSHLRFCMRTLRKITDIKMRHHRPLSANKVVQVIDLDSEEDNSYKYDNINTNQQQHTQNTANLIDQDTFQKNTTELLYAYKQKAKQKSRSSLKRQPVNHSPRLYQHELFFERRTTHQSEVCDLGVMSLDEIVDQAYNNQILTTDIYQNYVKNSTQHKIAQFITLLIQNQLSLWNFEQTITIGHHRRLAELLVQFHPEKYRICAPYSLDLPTRQFLSILYSLATPEHQKLLTYIDGISRLNICETYNKNISFPINIQLASYTPKTTQFQLDQAQRSQIRQFQEEIAGRLQQHYRIQKYRQSLCKHAASKQKKNRSNKKTKKHKTSQLLNYSSQDEN